MATSDGIRPGLEGRLERIVEGDLLTRHVGGKGTFSTPAMIGLMEWASHKALKGLLPEGQTSVGYEVHVRHLAPAAPGSTVVVTSKLTESEGQQALLRGVLSPGREAPWFRHPQESDSSRRLLTL